MHHVASTCPPSKISAAFAVHTPSRVVSKRVLHTCWRRVPTSRISRKRCERGSMRMAFTSSIALHRRTLLVDASNLVRRKPLPTSRRSLRLTPCAMSPVDWLSGLLRGKPRDAIQPPAKHAVLGTRIAAPSEWAPPYAVACFGMGCGNTGHAEVVSVVYDETKVGFDQLLDVFWAGHDPTTRNRQGNDRGTQYRSAVFYYTDDQKKATERSRDHFNKLLKEAGRNAIVTEITRAPEYFFAEEYHQQYLYKNAGGYCGLGGTGLYRPAKERAEK